MIDPDAPKEAAQCRNCGGDNLEIKFHRRFDEVAHMTLGDEWIALEEVPMGVVCSDCGYEHRGQGRGLTIDVKRSVILHCFVKVDED